MEQNQQKSSWMATVLFYLVLVCIVTILDFANDVLRWSYWGAQIALVTVGVGIFLFVGQRMPDLSAARGVFLAFTVGILTIIPAVLMGLGPIPELWPQYFYIALGMAAGSFLTFLFLELSPKFVKRNKQIRDNRDRTD